MKKCLHTLLSIGILALCFILLPNGVSEHPAQGDANPLREAAYEILQQKCNTCHQEQYRFMVFKESNMDRKAKRIYQAVYVNKTMPKGDEVTLTQEEYDTLKAWVLTQVDPK